MKKFREILVFCLLALFFLPAFDAAWAAPVFKRDETFRQPDGTAFMAVPYGDEWHNGYETKEGHTILFDEGSGWWVYADRASDGSLVGTEDIVGRALPLAPKHLRSSVIESRQRPNWFIETPPVSTTGSQNTLVILVQFTDRTLVTTEASWADLIFNSSTFSRVRDYMNEASYGAFDIAPAGESYGTANNGVVIVTLGYPHINTGGATGATNRAMVGDALIAADSYVNYASFDTNGNGYLSSNELNIITIIAGYEASYGTSCGPTVWGHAWALYGSEPPTLDGMVVAAVAGNGTYGQFGEVHCNSYNSPGNVATIGIIAHELGHSALRLPDEYDTDNSSEGIGEWGLMGSGSWNSCMGGYSGNCPPHPTVWDKWYLGWLTPTQVVGTQAISIPDITASPTAYQLLDNPSGVDWSFAFPGAGSSGVGEYFLLENRQLTGYNAGLPGSGLLIWHIWEGASSSNSANTNEGGARLIDLRDADGLNHLDNGVNRGDAGDPYPGSTSNTSFTGSLYCSSGIGFCAPSGVSVTNISASALTMTATVTAPGATGVDLVVSSITAPSSVVSGGTVSISATVTNQGTSASGRFFIAFFSSTDTTIDTSDTYLGYFPVWNGLGAGGSVSATVSFNIPPTAAPGTYYAGAFADVTGIVTETSETNNTRATSAVTLTSGADLIVPSVTAPSSANAGGRVPVTMSLRNDGSGRSGRFFVGFYISTDTTITTSDAYLGYRPIWDGLSGGETSTSTSSFTIPLAVAPGTYYIGAIADVTDIVIETDETNNTAATSAITISSGVDLVVSALSAPSVGTAGSAISVSSIVGNIGTIDSTRLFVEFYLSTDSTITTGDINIGYRPIWGGVPAGGSDSDTRNLLIPSYVAPGIYYLGAIADSTNINIETNETNNTRASGAITIASP